MRRSTVGGVVLLALSALGLLVDARVFLACWLAAWWWCLGLVLGLLVNAWMHDLTGGAWGLALRPVANAVAARLPWVLIAFIPVAIGWRVLFPWAGDPDGAWLHPITQPGFVRAWLSTPFFFARLVVYAIAWLWIARGGVAMGGGRAARSVIVYCLLTSLASVDLLMSLQPGWYSTAFGLVALSAQALAGAALAVLLQPHCPPVPVPQDAKVPPVSRDLGNLLLMWVMSWAYLAFMQFLIIWAEDLPREIAWYLPRLQTGWSLAGLGLVVLQFALPFTLLLFRGVKDRPARLAWVAALLLLATALDVAWMVVPSVAPHSLHVWWLQPLTFAGLGLLLFGDLPATLRAGGTRRMEELRHAHP
jgi:hypothetical protein